MRELGQRTSFERLSFPNAARGPAVADWEAGSLCGGCPKGHGRLRRGLWSSRGWGQKCESSRGYEFAIRTP